ncbi:hypothetical protein DUNSADRAFT_2323 [Dunaliella salina]|uniref:Uncharacterized protein n=1 Tax=Dunaliella salina TaxID=3046 RepID=A0ABQ7GVR1_DUNSA|nr:hypothetical protein DUNSADRAFT_2323 [Dunaliella salina]|eukprot:KAF5838698.1 hypothetical protein DUNSADRAFT_2323 [Dunaliella salina]
MGVRRLWASSGPWVRRGAIASGALMTAAAVNGVDAMWHHENYEERRQEERDQLRCKGIMDLLPERSHWQKIVSQER